MPQKKGAKGKKTAKVKDLPAKSLKANDAAKVKGGAPRPRFMQEFQQDLSITQPLTTDLNTDLNIDMNISKI